MKNSKLIRTTCSMAVSSVLLTMTGMAQADNGDANQQAVNALQQQVMQLQQQVQDLSSAMSDAKVKPNLSKATDDNVRISETPEGYRLIDTANSSVSLYGLIDFTLARESTGGPNGGIGAFGQASAPPAPSSTAQAAGLNNQPWTGMDVSWMNGNRWGITGHHTMDAQSNTKLIFKLESEFELPTGNFDGGYSSPILFNRDAWIGFSSPTIGKLTFGRQDTLGRDINMIWANPFSTDKNSYAEGGWMNNQVMYQMMEYSGSPTGNRWDDAIVWKKKWDNLWTYLGHQFPGLQNNINTGNYGNQYTDNVYAGKNWQGTQDVVGLGYNSSDDIWHVSSSYTYANYDGYNKNVVSIGGNIRPVSWLRLNGGIYHADIAQPISVNSYDSSGNITATTPLGNRMDNTYTVSAQVYPGGSWDYALAYYHIEEHNACIMPTQGYNGWEGGTAQPFDLTSNCAAPTAASIASGNNGTWGTVYGAAFYRWDKQTDLYVAADYSKVGGNYVSPYFQGNSMTTQFGVGMRYFF